MRKEKISLVILTKNGGKLFKYSIKEIYSQVTSFNFEVVIIDSGSTDGSLEYIKKYPARIIQINPADFSFGRTRDYGYKQTRGDIIVTLSQDVIPASDKWLENIVEPILMGKADVVQGKTIAPKGGIVFYWEKIGLFYFTKEGKQFIEKYGNIGLSCCSLAMKREVWEDTYFGNALMNEDKVIQRKIINKGYKIISSNRSIAYHGHNYNLRTLINRCQNEGLGWRCAGVKYSFKQMLSDLLPRKILYKCFLKGLLKREIKTIAEILFIFIRPIFLLKGNRFNKGYRR